jgi:hypothetical protein
MKKPAAANRAGFPDPSFEGNIARIYRQDAGWGLKKTSALANRTEAFLSTAMLVQKRPINGCRPI